MSEKDKISRIPRTGVVAPKSTNDDDTSDTGKEKTMKSSRTGVDAPKSINNTGMSFEK